MHYIDDPCPSLFLELPFPFPAQQGHYCQLRHVLDHHSVEEVPHAEQAAVPQVLLQLALLEVVVVGFVAVVVELEVVAVELLEELMAVVLEPVQVKYLSEPALAQLLGPLQKQKLLPCWLPQSPAGSSVSSA